MKAKSHIETMREAAITNRQEVQDLLGWSDMEYVEFQEQKGREYLRTVICPDGYGARELGNSRIFWRWWINQWNRRDDDFLNSDVYTVDRLVLGDETTYINMHNPAFLSGQYPHRVVFEASYSGAFLDAK